MNISNWNKFKRIQPNVKISEDNIGIKRDWRPLKILLCRYTAIGGRGDILLATPTFRALKKKYPNCHITLYTAPHLAIIIRNNPHVDRIVTTKPNFDEYDQVIHLDYIKLPSHLHIIDAFAINAGVELPSKKSYLYVGKKHFREAERFRWYYGIKPDDITIAVHKGPTWPERMWQDEKYIEVARYFKEKYGAKFIELSQFEGMGLGLGIDLTGKTSIRQTAAIVKGCTMLLCVDSFVLHIAGAMGTPVVALFGCTNPAQRMPFDDISIAVDTPCECKHCYHWDQSRLFDVCRRDRIYCMEAITVESVIEAMEKLLERIREKSRT